MDADDLVRLYEYAARAYYYGHQYRHAYEAQKNAEQKSRYLLEFAGEASAWMMLAVLSGVVGNAAYDLVKMIVVNIRRDIEAGKLPTRDYSALLCTVR